LSEGLPTTKVEVLPTPNQTDVNMPTEDSNPQERLINGSEILIRDIANDFYENEIKPKTPDEADKLAPKNSPENVLANVFILKDKNAGTLITEKNPDGHLVTVNDNPLIVNTENGNFQVTHILGLIDDKTALVRIKDGAEINVSRSALFEAEMITEGELLINADSKLLTDAQKKVVEAYLGYLKGGTLPEGSALEELTKSVQTATQELEEVKQNRENVKKEVEQRRLVISDFDGIDDPIIREMLLTADLSDSAKLKEIFGATPERQLKLAQETQRKFLETQEQLKNLKIGTSINLRGQSTVVTSDNFEFVQKVLKSEIKHDYELSELHNRLAKKLEHKNEAGKIDQLLKEIASGTDPELIGRLKNALKSNEELDDVIRIVFDEAKISLDPSKLRENLIKGGKYGSLLTLLLLFASIYSATKQRQQ